MNDRELLKLLKKALNDGPLQDHEVRAYLELAIETLEEREAVEDWASR